MPDIDVGGVRLHYQRLGEARSATAVVFLHGLVMDNLASWYFTVAPAVAPFADVLLYDLRGHGRSGRPRHGYGVADHVADLRALLEGVGRRGPVYLVGNSFGGLLAVAFARAFPHLTAGLVLVDAHLGDDDFGGRMAATLSLRGDARDQAIAASFEHWLGRHSDRKRNRLAETAGALVEGTSLVADMAATPPLTPRELREVHAPVLALYGERSDLRARSERLLAGLPGARTVVLPGCTHSILWEATDVVREAVVGFTAPPRPLEVAPRSLELSP